ncbi:MAG: zinc ribbon domain-containing protein [Flavobacteriales bacterium]|nr:zinc ribbon domain-containing protein [Flavobacteriales bacterium]
MAIIECIECKGNVSDLAETCPHCGAPVSLSVKTEPKETECFECKKPIKVDQDVCLNCGVRQALKDDLGNKEIAEKEQQENSKETKKPSVEAAKEENVKSEKIASEKAAEPKSKPQVVYVQEEKKKGSVLRTLAIILASLLIFFVLLAVFLPNNVKRDLYQTLGIENSDYVKQNGLASYVEFEAAQRETLFGKTAITGTIRNNHPTATIRTTTLRFNFSDGSEDRQIYKVLPPNSRVKLFNEKFNGHRNATLRSVEVIDAND